MAFNNALTNTMVDYTIPASKILVDTLFGGSAFKGFTIMSGVKYKEEMAILESEITIQANGCGIQPNTGVTLAPRYVEVKDQTVEQEFCWQTLQTKYLREKELIPNITKSLIDNIQMKVEKDVWSGSIADGDMYNGILHYVNDEATESTWNTATTALSSSNVNEAVLMLISEAPKALRVKASKVIFASPAIYNMYLDNRLAANAFMISQNDLSENEMKIVGHPSWTIRLVEGLVGYNFLFAAEASNFILVVDEESKISSATWKVDDYNKYAKFVAEFKSGAQVQVPGSIIRL